MRFVGLCLVGAFGSGCAPDTYASAVTRLSPDGGIQHDGGGDVALPWCQDDSGGMDLVCPNGQCVACPADCGTCS